MTTDTKAVETNVDVAATSTETVVTPITTEIDYEAVLAQTKAELAKVRDERENYRKGMLKAKGKLSSEDSTDTESEGTTEALVERLVQEKFLSTREAQLQADSDATVMKLAKRNKELELALKNRASVTTVSAQGSNSDKATITTDDYLSKDQLNALKAKGWDDKKIEQFKANAKKISSLPRNV